MKTGYLVRLSYEDEFVNLMSSLKAKYPRKVFQIQGLSNENLDINAFSKNFFGKSASKAARNVANISSDPNANISSMTISQWTTEHGKGILKVNSLYLIWDYVRKCFSQEDADEIVEAVVTGAIFVNDGHQFERPYCFGFDLNILASEGLTFFEGPMKIKAPTRTDSFVELLIQATALAANHVAGATSFPTFFVNFDYFLRKDLGDDYASRLSLGNLSDKKSDSYIVSNLLQKLIYSWNFPFRGSQSPFVNVSVYDRTFLESLFGTNEYGAAKYTNPDGSSPDLDSIYILQKFFYEYFDSIFGEEGIFTFPVVTLALSTSTLETGEIVFNDLDFVDWVSRVYGDKCVANIYSGPATSFSSCCRMKNDFSKLEKRQKEYQNSFGVGGISIGSTRVVGLNFPRIAFEMRQDKTFDFKPYVDKYVSMCHKVLIAHRKLLDNHIAAGVLPLYDSGWIRLDNQYITYGFIGAYEFLDILGYDITKEEGSDYLVDVLKFVEGKMEAWAEEDNIIGNLEQIPGESMAVRLAALDKILGFNKNYDTELYSNQYLPLTFDANMYDRFKIQGIFDTLTSGGSILHLNVHDGAELSPAQIKKLINLSKETGTVYWAINRVFCKCTNDHYTISNNGKCNICGASIETQYTRVVGFITPVKSWVQTRQDKDYPNRVFYGSVDNVIAE